MDPITAAGSFATIMGLICNYRQEMSAREANEHQTFMEWLEYHRHEEIKKLICTTTGLLPEIDKLLRVDHAVIMAKLEAINTTLASLTSHVSEFRGLTLNLVPSAELSEQAVSILRQLVESGSSYFTKMAMRFGPMLHLESGGQIQYTEQRFLNDDLDKLVSLHLLTESLSSSGREKIFRITREAVRFIEAVDGEQK